MLLIFERKTMLKEIIYFSCNNKSEIEDILDDLITYSDPNKNQKFYHDLYPETANLDELIKDIKNQNVTFEL